MKHLLTTAALIAVSTAPALASTTSVDLSTWVENGNPNNGAGTWIVQGGNDSVVQTINGNPTVFFDPSGGAQGKELGGTIKVKTSVDDDFIGFVLGYSNGEINSTSADFWLVDWKKGNQDGALAGIALSHVSGNLVGTDLSTTGPWWQHDAPVTEVQRGASLGSTGWAINVEYEFSLTFTATNTTVSVNGNEELNYTGSFTNGGFGFYNLSQENVEYAGITTAPAVPLPASLPLLAAGFGAIALMRRKRQAA